MREITFLHKRMTQRHRPSELLSLMAYDTSNCLFFHEDGYSSFGFVCTPLISPSDTVASQLQVLLQLEFPANSQMQVCLWASPDIEGPLFAAAQLRKHSRNNRDFAGRKLAEELVANRIEFLRHHTEEPIPGGTQTRVRDTRTAFIFKIPCGKQGPTEDALSAIQKLRSTVLGSLESIGLGPVTIDPERYLRFVGAMVNWGAEASWKSPIKIYSEDRLIREQLFDPESSIQVQDDGLILGGKHVRTACVKRYPESVHLVQAAQYLSDLRTGTRGVREPILITLNIYLPAPDEARAGLGAKKSATQYQAEGRLARYASRIRDQAASLDLLSRHIDGGDRIVKAYLSFALFADTADEATRAGSNLVTYYRELGFSVQADRYIALPVFLNALPFGVEASAVENLFRYRTMATIHAAHLMPVVADWKGTGTPVSLFTSRTGGLMCFDAFDSPTNYSAVVAAESGSGKSFLVQAIMADYLSIGAQVFVIEVGRSFKNACLTLGGDHMEFRPGDAMSINPFSSIIDYTEQADLLLAAILSMISPGGHLEEYQVAVLRRVLKEVWDTHGKNGTIDDLAKALLAARGPEGRVDTRVTDMGTQLYAFTSEGEYGAWFNSPASIDFRSPLTVCELVDLKERKHLQKVVLVQLISVIQRAMYLGDTETPKLLIIDEGWDLLTGGTEGTFIERGVRQLRKHRGGAWIILQSINDLYRTSTGTAIAENTAHKILLGQTPEAIDGLIESKRLSLGPGAAQVLKSLHTRRGAGAYSEFFLYTRAGGGVGRLVVDRFTQLMFSTDPTERHEIEQRRARGMEVREAIEDLIRSEKGKREEAA